MTETADQHISAIQSSNYEQIQEDQHSNNFEDFQVEKKVFNTGPCANKTMPAQYNVISTDQKYASFASNVVQAHTSGDGRQSSSDDVQFVQVATKQPSNESSSFSNSVGESQDIVEVTNNNVTPKNQLLNAVVGGCEKKIVRKRKHQDGAKHKDTPRTKITDFMGIQSQRSPRRSCGPSTINGGGGDSRSNESTNFNKAPYLNSSPPFPNNQIISANITIKNQRTPTLITYHSSDSNQSPLHPTSSTTEVEVQTDFTLGTEDPLLVVQKEKYREELIRLNTDLKQNLEVQKSKVRASRETIKGLLIDQSRMQRKQAKERCMEATLRIGQFKPTRLGENFREQWMDGWAMEEVNKKLKQIAAEREQIVNASKNLRCRKAPKDAKTKLSTINTAGSEQPSSSVSSIAVPSPNVTTIPPSYTADSDGFLRPPEPLKAEPLTAQEYMEQEEIYRLRKEHLKKEETDLMMEKDRLERERNLHIREMRRIQSEEQSRYRNHELLNERYLLLSLLGKGGFSEVWRAFDLDENRYVACKIHHVNKDWKEDKKANYVKHAMREKDIHMSLDHARIVRLFAVFSIDNDSFCTVLEYCDGNDLDFYLKQQKQIPEKEARIIVMQVVSALKYLSELKNPVIHYDLKPANILLQSGSVGSIKLTDFGLSKMVENAEDGDESIELTSQGAGTYWYLPPETFAPYSENGPPKISSKVDVWSVGVIFYQCIYGKRPFGHEKTQTQILEERTIYNAQEVNFPTKPVVSASAQDFIRRCLQCKKEERADINELYRHDLFTKPRGQKAQQMSPSSRRQQESRDDID